MSSLNLNKNDVSTTYLNVGESIKHDSKSSHLPGAHLKFAHFDRFSNSRRIVRRKRQETRNWVN